MSDTDGKINWFEIPAAETDRARSFYGGLFGWTIRSRSTTTDGKLTVHDPGGTPIGRVLLRRALRAGR